MIIQNRASEIGDVIYIQTDAPLIGLIALVSFSDDTEGEYADRSFKKTFRYSTDGVTWTPFVELTIPNIAGVEINATNTFYAEYRYERIGTDPTQELAFNSVTLNGVFKQPDPDIIYTNTNFNNFFPLNNICSIGWSVNVLEKLYKKGILPNYIERNTAGDGVQDKDFIDYWRAVTHFFALFVCLAREFQYFYNNPTLLLEYVRQRGMFACTDTTQVDLLYLVGYFYDEIRQRGTRQVFLKKSDDKPVDGEYLRLICYHLFDEFVYNLNKPEHVGWNLDNSSPLYKGLEGRLNMNKFVVDFIEDLEDLSQLSITPGSEPYVAIYESSDSNSSSNSNSNSNHVKEALIIYPSQEPFNQTVGIGGSTIGLVSSDKRIVVNPHLDYEITFLVKADITHDQNIIFGVNTFDKDGNFITLVNNSNQTPSNTFLSDVTLNKANKYYFVRGIIYRKNSFQPYDSTLSYDYGTVVLYGSDYYRAKRNVPIDGTITDLGTVSSVPGISLGTSPTLWNFWELLTTSEVQNVQKTNIGKGNNLVFQDHVVSIDPVISFDNFNGSVNKLYIQDIRVQILSTPYSKGFVQVSNFLEIWNTNNNANESKYSIEKKTKKYLIPYNTVLKDNFIPSELN